MSWLLRYRLQHFLRVSFWLVPVGSLMAAMALLPLVRWIDRVTGWTWFGFTPEGARAILGGLSASMLTFLVFVVSSLLLVVQLASTQLTPRIIAFTLARWLGRGTVAVFVFSYTFTLGVLGRVEVDRVPQLSVLLAVFGNLGSIALFLWFAQRLGGSLRPVAVLQAVAAEGRAVIDSVFPRGLDVVSPAREASLEPLKAPGGRLIAYAGASGVFLAFGGRELVELARRAGCALELLCEVGDFVSRGDALFRVHPAESPIDAQLLQQCVAFGPERTLEQDPAFVFRVIADIASRALSPALNDPTTAVIALDHIHSLLRQLGRRHRAPGAFYDGEGKLRLLVPTPTWEDFVCLAVSEIRLFGAGSIAVARRLRAMLQHLIAVLPELRADALRRELELLDRAVEREYADPADRERAGVGDRQGLGGLPENDPSRAVTGRASGAQGRAR